MSILNNPTTWLNMIWKADIPSQSKLIAAYLRRFMNDESAIAYPSLKRICADVNLTKPTVLKYLDVLIEHDFLEKTSGDRTTSNKYKLNIPDSGSKGDLLGVVKDVYQGSKGDLLGVVKDVYPNKQHLNKQINKQTNNTGALFLKFWLAGMKKLNKTGARKSFDRVIKVETDKNAFVDNLILDIQKRLSLDQLGFDKMHPTTYLNNRRWEDDYAENNNTSSGNSGTRRKTGAEIAQNLRDSLGETADGFWDEWETPQGTDETIVASYDGDIRS